MKNLNGWHPMSTAPRDGTPVLLFSQRGIFEAWFARGEWSENYETGPEYSGDCWVCCDDTFEIEVEWYKATDTEPEEFYDGEALFWKEKPEVPELDE